MCEILRHDITNLLDLIDIKVLETERQELALVSVNTYVITFRMQIYFIHGGM